MHEHEFDVWFFEFLTMWCDIEIDGERAKRKFQETETRKIFLQSIKKEKKKWKVKRHMSKL